jgi:hypothetical protein
MCVSVDEPNEQRVPQCLMCVDCSVRVVHTNRLFEILIAYCGLVARKLGTVPESVLLSRQLSHHRQRVREAQVHCQE